MKFDARSVVLGAVGGGCIAGGAVYIFVSNRFRAELDAEAAKIREEYKERIRTLLAPGEDDPFSGVKITDPNEQSADETSADPEVTGEIVVDQETIVEEDGSSKIEITTVKLGENQVNDAPVWPPKRRNRRKPYVISREERDEEVAGGTISSVLCDYYAGDDVLLDSDQEPMTNRLQAVGPVTRAMFGGVSEDENELFIRNEKLECDFTLMLHEGKYTDDILHYGDPGAN